MTRYRQVSGGAGSWLAARLDMRANPSAAHRFVFCDTLYEDADCYRFLIEGVANLLGRAISVPAADEFPDYRVAGDFDIATYAGNPEWRAYLAALRARMAMELPELIWLVEGRDPWEVFRDRRFLGNSRRDPCSDILKRKMLDAWRTANCDPAKDVFIVGIGPHEKHRFEGGRGKRGLRARMAETGWTYLAPLIGPIEGEIGPFLYMAQEGLERPRLYRRGYIHNNCGGFYIKAGHAHYHNRLTVDPDRYAYDAMMERKISEYVGQAVSMMTDRSGGDKKPYSLLEMRERWQALPDGTDNMFLYEEGDSGCGCMVDE